MKLASALHERFAAWALRARPPEALPVPLSQRRVYIVPTGAGLAFAAALLVMFVGAINYNLSLGHALVFLLAGLGIVAILHTFRNLVGIVVESGRAEPVFAGEIAHFLLLLRNPRDEERRLVQAATPGGGEDRVDIPGGATAEVRLGLIAARRGWLPLPRVTFLTTFPLGLARAWSYAQPDVRCLVYPRPALHAPPWPVAGGGEGARMQDVRGSEDFAGLRSHQPADPPRHIAWKAAARQPPSAPLLTKQFAGAAAETVWFDWDMLAPGTDAETRLSILARWILDAAAAGSRWGLRLSQASLAPDGGDAHLRACLKALALHEAP